MKRFSTFLQSNLRRTGVFFCVLLTFASCSPTRFYKHKIRHQIVENNVFAHSFTGFTLQDAQTGQILCDVLGDRHFIPASTNKIWTLYTCLELLGDSLPSFKYTIDRQALVIYPTGDPCFLHPKFSAWQSGFAFMQQSKAPILGWTSNTTYHAVVGLGPGWAWDDAHLAYSAEKSNFPLFGNVRDVFAIDSSQLRVSPAYWQAYLQPDTLQQPKDALYFGAQNRLSYNPQHNWTNYEARVPIQQAADYVGALLSDTLHRPFVQLNAEAKGAQKTWYGTPVDTVYRRMMHQSDNFIAEQLLLLCAGQKTGLFNQDTLIQWAKDSLFSFLPQKLRWVDGSGLSRYNLNTPRNNVALLYRLWQTQPRERLFDLFPAGGTEGTLKGWYKNTQATPYIYAKTGSMSGVQCLSGYLITRKGKVLIFSFMHNNFVGSGKAWKTEMQRILEQICSN
ncbi:MAG: D-alanyl-D-alanine carboxypeptidase [Saprospiraceae bacterium]|nr:D-alanyl-D-alanine carboxypeptidase [Saprospiraceae bacterium]